MLETGELQPVGGSDCRIATFRLIAATNRILEQRVSNGEFRNDLKVQTLQHIALHNARLQSGFVCLQDHLGSVDK